MTFKICVSIPVRDIKKIHEDADKAKYEGADLIELRFDFLNSISFKDVRDAAKIVRSEGLPSIFTLRSEREGGFFPETKEAERANIILEALNHFDFVDIELETRNKLLGRIIKTAMNHGVKTIISKHNFKRTPKVEEILKVLRKERKLNAYICKYVSMARNLRDNLTVLEACLKFSGRKILFCAGELGIFSRVITPIYGSEWTYASLNEHTAPGQLNLQNMRNLASLFSSMSSNCLH